VPLPCGNKHFELRGARQARRRLLALRGAYALRASTLQALCT